MGTKFKDRNGQEWTLHLTLGLVKQINDEMGVNLLAPWDGRAIDELVAEPIRLGDILARAISPKDEKQAEALAEGLRGEGLDNAIAAFCEDLASFFPAGQRAAFAAFMKAARDVQMTAWSDVAKTYNDHGNPS